MKKTINSLLISGLALGTFGLGTLVLAEDSKVDEKAAQEEVITESSAMESSNVETKTSETTPGSSTSEAKKDTADVTKVEEKLEKVVGEKKGEDVPVETNPQASKIREELSSGDFGITKEQLAKYTDEQLEQAMTLFTRYNYDVTGMDYGAYGRLLKTLYGDKTVNVNDALTQLSFDPSSFNSFSEMIPQVDKLQKYLQTLYPTNSTFIAGISYTNDQLIAKLNKLQKMEDELKAAGQTMPFGRIAGLLQADTDEGTGTSSSTSETKTTTTSESGKKDKVTPTSSSDKKGGFLPKTGEQQGTIALATLGVFTILGTAFVLRKKL
ncbi:LPXTG cell wall anchor domain-containing protein [Vagococcus hydrophili]|uniref:LPXTG cell wall anchor domain-containing protein n=1 Tax=Vagococcus hydrophili TaxID=2714947 RepID=A0A6G8AUL3_9ENTE|nr:LPXTG cell wall anchor domain-containing protein [Vagococcus hydrophili]QIL48758.1 LPXTG cell wall anchor domain-containing protein [Vagococcus hydrophili]